MNSEILDSDELPETFEDENSLEEFMTRPTQVLIDDLNALDGGVN